MNVIAAKEPISVVTVEPMEEGTTSEVSHSVDSSGKNLAGTDLPLTPSPEVQWIYETAPIGLACLSTDCRYLLINQRLTEICGISVADHIGRSVRETVPQVAEQVEEIVQNVLRSGESITGIEINGQRTDEYNGDRFWSTSWHPLRGADGTILGINVVAEEITERKRAETALRGSEARFRELSQTLEQRVEIQARERDRTWKASQDLLVVADSTGRYLSVNPAWTAALGWSQGELLDRTSEWLIHPDDLEKTRRQIDQLVAGEKVLHFDNRLRHKDGSFRWFSWTGVVDQGQIYAAGRDMTDLRKAQADLRQSRDELARVNRQTTMAAMTASIAHEINQPLSAIVTNCSAALRWLARKEPNNDEAHKAVNRAIEDAHRASEVISSVRAMFGRDHRAKQPLRLNDLIGDVLTLVHGELESHQAGIQLDLEANFPEILGDRIQIQQVLLNLFTNAIEAMDSINDRPRTLSIKSELADPDNILISVKDSGPGIALEDTNHIFDAFFTTKSHGMGMGLSICRSIVENHGGHLWAEPGTPCGSIFLMTLPSKTPASHPE
jgi:PAS domain S-box-containing protein